MFRRILDSFSDTSHSSTIHLTHELLSQTLEEKSNIYVRSSIILYISPIENKIFFFTGIIKDVLSGILTPCLIGAVVVIKKESEVVKRWSNDLERNAVSIFKNLGVLSKSTHEGSVLFQIKHYSVQLANEFVVCISNRV